MRQAEAARAAHGTSYAEIGRALRLGAGQVARIMRGDSPNLAIVRAAQVLEAVGLQLSAGAHLAGAPVRDAGQVALLHRFRARVSAELTWREEVPVVELPVPGIVDHRAWDAALDGPVVYARVEAETHAGDAQALARRIALKQRDGHVSCVILLLARTRHHRRVLDEAGDGLRAMFPVSQRTALAALARGDSPGGNALILL